jgi:hypothetical protein
MAASNQNHVLSRCQRSLSVPEEIGDHPMQHSDAGAYMYKDMSGYWSYYP